MSERKITPVKMNPGVSARAATPDQLVSYVKAVSGLESLLLGQCVLHHAAGQGVLVAYPLHDPLDRRAASEAIAAAMERPGLERLSILAPFLPDGLPNDAESKSDAYWKVDLPPKISGKLRNTLKRASRDLEVTKNEPFGYEHESLVTDFCKRKQGLDAGTKFLLGKLGDYLAQVPDATLFSARRANGELVALAIGDFTSLSTAFYMFACRKADATPGAADLLLSEIVNEANSRGHMRLNLGLGIDNGVEFFKQKWGAKAYLPYVETSFTIQKKGVFARLFGRK